MELFILLLTQTDVATDRLVKVKKHNSVNGISFSVQQMISCVVFKNGSNGCNGSTVDVAWNKLNQNNKNGPRYAYNFYGLFSMIIKNDK